MPDTIKFANFVGEAIGNKKIGLVPGVGPAYGRRLRSRGFTTAYKLLGQFLLMDKDEEMFTDWLKETVDMDPRDSGPCFEALKEWCLQHGLT